MSFRPPVRPSDLERPVVAVLLLLILLGYLLAALRITRALPIGHGPDGPLHLQYIRFVADTLQLPTAVLPPEDNVASQESVQPPLFYVVTAVLTGWTAHPAIARPAAGLLAQAFAWLTAFQPDPSVLYVAPPGLWPQSTVVSGYAARGVSMLAGLLALGCLFGWLRELSGSRWLALAGTAWLGWNFNFPYIHAVISNDAFLALFVTAGLWQVTRILHALELPLGEGAPKAGVRGEAQRISDRSLVWLGVLLGALALVKLNGLVVLPVAGLAVLWVTPGRRLRSAAIVGGTVVAMAGWWYARNLLLYGDLTGLRMFAAIEDTRQGLRPAALSWTALWPVLTGAVDALLYYYLPWLALVVLNSLAFTGALLAAGRRSWRLPVVLLAAVVLLVVASYLGWAGRFVYGTAPRLLLPAWPALAGLWVAGFAAWLPRRIHPLVPLVILPIVAAHLVGVMDKKWAGGDRPTSYTFIPVLSPYDQPQVDREWAVDFGPYLTLTGSRLIRQGDQAIVALHFRLREGIRDPQTSFYVHVVDAQGDKVAQANTFYQTDPLPLSSWRRGQTVVCLYRLRLSRQATGPLQVYTGVYSRQTMQTLPATDAGIDVPGGDLLVGLLPAGP
jgi:hypothetical protein